jgi:hypothetical protein
MKTSPELDESQAYFREHPFFSGLIGIIRSKEWKLSIYGVLIMCRNIRQLYNFEPPVTDDEIQAAATQFVRKITGFNKPSKANEAAFLTAVDEIARVSRGLLSSLETNAPPKNRAEENAKASARAVKRFSG